MVIRNNSVTVLSLFKLDKNMVVYLILSTGESYRGLAECWVADKGAFLVVRVHVIIQKVCGQNIWLHAKDSFVNFEKGNRIIAANVYICTGEDFISLQLVSYPFVLFCMTIKYV
jgi:hypothetical protein